MPANVSAMRAFCAALALAAIVTGPLPSAAFASEQVSVQLDQAKLMKLPAGVHTIVVGNPLIADVTLQPGNLAVLTGKGFGTTNMVALDRTGNVVLDQQVQVQGASDQIVTVYRGAERETYSCTPVCQRRMTLGDSTAYFDATSKQIDSRNSQAAGKADQQQQQQAGSQSGGK